MYDLSEKNIIRLKELSKRIRLSGLEMALASGSNGSHLGGSFSCVEILSVLYGEVLRYWENDPLNNNRDRFLPSKNHCVLAHLPALAEMGFIQKEELQQFQMDGGRLTGYPMRPEIGLEYSGGSLGMALSVGIGMALNFRQQGNSAKVYVLLGDGELDEGSCWEAIMSASHYKLDNLIAIVDRNHLSYDGNTEDIMGLNDLEDKFCSFGWDVVCCDGHNEEALLHAFSEHVKEKPHVVIAETVKGKGVSFMENKPEWHHHVLNLKQYEEAKMEIMGGN